MPVVQDMAGNVVWANDSATLFYVTKDKLDRPDKVWRYMVGGGTGGKGISELVYHEVAPRPPSPPSPPSAPTSPSELQGHSVMHQLKYRSIKDSSFLSCMVTASSAG